MEKQPSNEDLFWLGEKSSELPTLDHDSLSLQPNTATVTVQKSDVRIESGYTAHIENHYHYHLFPSCLKAAALKIVLHRKNWAARLRAKCMCVGRSCCYFVPLKNMLNNRRSTSALLIFLLVIGLRLLYFTGEPLDTLIATNEGISSINGE